MSKTYVKMVGMAKPYRPNWRSEEDELTLPIYLADRRYVPMQYNDLSKTTGKAYSAIVLLKRPVEYEGRRHQKKSTHRVLLLGTAALSFNTKSLQALIDYETELLRLETQYEATNFHFAHVDRNIIRFNGLAEIDARRKIIERYGSNAISMFDKVEKLNVKSQKATGIMLREELGKRQMFKFVQTTNADFISYIKESILMPISDEDLADEMDDKANIHFSDEVSDSTTFIDDASEILDMDDIIGSVV